jgi:regulator of protease activity HflC (stomatin/prohibitin superfamily)
MRPLDATLYSVLALAGMIAIAWWVVRLVRTTFTRTTIFQYQAGVRYRDGVLVDVVGPGRYPTWRPGVRIEPVELRDQSMVVPGQEMLTKDNLAVRASVAATITVADARRYVMSAEDPKGVLYESMQVALRTAVAARTLEQFLDVRSAINEEVVAAVTSRASELGMAVKSVALLDVMLSGETKRAYADIFRARKDGEAALERARGETAALRNLANAARMLKDNPGLFNLRLLQTLTTSAAKGATVVLNTTGENVIGAGSPPEPVAEKATD